MSILDEAIIFAVNAHKGQFRKGTDIPYIVHPMEAAAIVATMSTDEEIIAGAVLHDVLEDTETTPEQIRAVFGNRVFSLVAVESENKREDLPAEDTWEIRKQETLQELAGASIEAKMIALGDKLSNIRAIHRDYIKLGDKLWERFNQKDKCKHQWYYSGIADGVAELSETPAFQEYKKLVALTFQ